MGSWSLAPPHLTHHRLLTVRMPLVVSPQHPLAFHPGPIPTGVLAEHIQLVHIDPSDLSRAGGLTLLSPRVWRLAHLGAKLAFLRAGLGFGRLPMHVIEVDLASGALVEITAESSPPEGYVIAMSAIYRTDSPPGPAGRWFIDRLKQQDARWLQEKARLSVAAPAKRQRSYDGSLALIESGQNRGSSTAA
jgi:DNA-binding transcriptional LysR family regulator